MKKNIIYTVFAAILLLAVPFRASAQGGITVSGTVRDSQGEPVMGAVVLFEGKAGVGSITDANGKYTLKVPSSKGRLAVQCLGYADQSVELTSASVYDFTLTEDAEMLERVVVVGYGTMRESDITGSVAQVKVNDNDAVRATSLDQMLKGRAAGVQVQTSSGAPGAGIDIKIRGNSSFSSGGEPLYVVDGVIINSGNESFAPLSKGGLQAEQTSGLLGINPQDIASMEILKDASATAIYGALGANGVILITTKQADKERPVINFNAGVELARTSKKIDILDREQYGEYLRAKNYTTGLNHIYVNAWDNSMGYKVDEVDWQDYMMRTAVNNRYYLSVANRSKTTSYMFSVSYKSTEGTLKNTDLNQFNARLSLDQKITKALKVGLKVNVSKVNSNMLQGTASSSLGSMYSTIRNMLASRPYYNFDDDDEEAAGLTEDAGARPDRWLRDYVNKRQEYRVIPNLFAEYRILPWLTYKVTAGGDYRVKNGVQWKGPFVTYDTNWALAGRATSQKLQYNIDNMLMFDRKIGNGHNISGTLGTTFFSASSISESSQGWNIPEYYGQYYSINSAPLTSTQFSYSESAYATLSFLARAVYSYKGRYILTATFRRDGSSRFARSNRYANFPSFAFAWRINEEPWFNFDRISSLKLRLGWGRVGNQAVSSYQTLSNYGSIWYADHSIGNDKVAIRGLYPSNLANAGLKWETTEQTNAGIDLRLNRNRLSFTLDVYNKDTKDLLQSVKVPVTTGFTSMMMNIGSINNRGIEFTTDATVIKKRDFRWDVFGNISHNENKITSIGIPSDGEDAPYFYGSSIGTGNYIKTPVNIFVEGKPMGLLLGIKTDGIVQVGETGPGLTLGETFGPGAVKYADITGDGIIDDTDRQVIGDPNPDFTYGFGTNLSWKNLSLDVQFEGVYGNDIANINLVQELDSSHNTQNIRDEAFYQAWTPGNPTAKYPALGSYTTAENKFFSDRYVEDGSYLRLSSVTLSYDVPLPKTRSVVNGITLSVSAQNLWILTKYSGWDPDVSSYGNNIMRMGCDYGSYPKARTLAFDVKLRF